jgi:L-ascorbate metabolism protein UlaG (beta-lactamase superfamily)
MPAVPLRILQHPQPHELERTESRHVRIRHGRTVAHSGSGYIQNHDVRLIQFGLMPCGEDSAIRGKLNSRMWVGCQGLDPAIFLHFMRGLVRLALFPVNSGQCEVGLRGKGSFFL